jgi:hypothetical protein
MAKTVRSEAAGKSLTRLAEAFEALANRKEEGRDIV